MRPRLIRLIMLACVMLASIHMYGQDKALFLGTTQQLLKNLQQPVSKMVQQQQVTGIQLKVSSTETFFAKANFRQAADNASERIIGEIAGVPRSSFYIKVAGNSLLGNIILQNSKKAYKYYSDNNGNAYVKEVDINKVICVDYATGPEGASNATTHARGQAPLAIDPNLLKLESFPGAKGCILLDFDGQYVSGTQWNNGNPINAQPANLTDAQILEVWELISEDYKPFHVNITTNETVFNTYAKNRRMRVIFTPTNTAAPGAGGVAYLESFSWNDDTPCWVFNNGVKGAGDAGAHEAGHTVGLNHDGRTSPAEEYYAGQGDWAPIMGVSYYKPIGQWSKGEYASANNTEDDLSIVTSATYGFGYRTDDYGNTTGTASPLVFDAGNSVKTAGLIERTGDIDVFSFSTSGGNISLNFNPATRHPDLDILATIYNSSGGVVTTANPAGLPASISTNLAAGNYFVSVTGTGAGNPRTDGYSNYGSLGVYTITGTIPRGSGGNQPPVVNITVPTSGTSYTAPANINIQATATDSDGSVAKVEFFNGSTSLAVVNAAPYNYAWNNVGAGSYTITAVATDDKGATTTSAPVNISVTTSGNQPPRVNITSPANNASFTAPASVAIQATATDSDGSIVSVEFFNGSTSLAVVSAPPYSYTWSNVATGNYVLTAKATDNQGSSTTSAAVNIKVSNGGGNCAGVPAYQPYPKIYSKGERAVYNNNLYECTSDGIYNITPGSAWWWWTLIGPCSGSSAVQSVRITNDVNASDQLSVYPNPVTGNMMQLQVSGQPGEQLIIEVWSLNGNQPLLRQTHVIGAKGPQVIRLDVSKVPAGSWIIRTNNQQSGKQGSIKIVRI
ncbi:MAG TPA: Ig-like domain-containing protein [Chitinophaga sp.]|uniref:Ig-like domain-containing protein n=1 Tax=Chitinophaga sp. TaxID=1869181 RepID=UPI002BFA03DE|nr:Ig-like domain-containing protein [Chitinophaga sp.]HVI49033.1 Ig-like domain-containing protein [Chitinophaga sp.]